MSETANSGFRVVIVGGGVAGLTLANALEQAAVEYVLLERRGEVAPQVGASIGIWPSAARILDQLGAWKQIDEQAEPLRVLHSRNSNGKLRIAPDRSSPLLVHARTGYWIVWGERQKLLSALYENLRDPSKVHVNKDLVDVKHDADGVTAICADGTSFRGDILVGADGVFSRTRSWMWELAEPEQPDVVKAERNGIISEYNCLFGISRGVTCPQLAPGDVHTTYNPGRCSLIIAAEDGKVYWFAQERLPETYHLNDIPRYTDEDAKSFIARNGDIVNLPGPNGLTLVDLWDKTVSSRLVAIEEGKFKLWHWGRIACVGDSIHKSTPNLGVGGNVAVESAAALANGIKRLADSCADTGRRPSQQDIESMLAEYQRSREVRAAASVDASGFLARAHNEHGLGMRLFVKYVMPLFAEFIPEMMGNAIIGATKLDYLPLPMASLTGTKPFNPTQGEGFRESKLKRMLFALPFIGLCFTAGWVMNVTPAIPWAEQLRNSGTLMLPSGSIPILRSFYHLDSFDDFVALVNTFFFPSVYGTDPLSRRQALSFLTDGTVLLTIWIFESARRANMLTPLQLPNLFTALGQMLGIGLVSPLYCFLHYTLSPIENFSALDQRLTQTRVSYTALPAIALTYLFPFYATLFWPDLPTRQSLLYVWQLYPVWLALSVWVISRVGIFKDTMASDKVYHPLKDMPVMRWYVGTASVLAAGVWVWAWVGYGMGAVFVPSALPRSMPSLEEFAGQFLRWDEVFGLGSHLVWLGYLLWDLRVAGMLREGWVRVVALGLVSVLFVGPGATLGLGWLFREHILATRRHKDALTPESVGRLHGEAF